MHDLATNMVLNQKAIALKKMTPYLATGIAEGFEEADNRGEVLAAWQYLHNTGLAYKLQGWFGRTAQSMIEQGLIDA